VIQTAPVNTPRFDHNPETLVSKGLLFEDRRTNSIRNNTMVGAVAGTPGTLPTNWSVASAAGLTTNVIGTGTSGGVTYIDLRITGTATGISYVFVPEAATQIAALNGQAWASSAWWSVVAGNLTNVTAYFFDIRELDSGGVQLNSGGISVSAPTSTFTRIAASRTTSNASTAFVQPRFRFAVTNGAAVDFTLRIGLPQLERGAFATSVIPTTTTALTRAGDLAVMTGTNFSSWYNQSEGTVAVAFDVYAPSVPDGFGRVYQIDNGIFDTTISLLKNNGSGSQYFGWVRVAEVTQVVLYMPAILANTPVKVATAYKLNDFAQSTNGGSVTTDTSGAIPTVTQMQIGSTAGLSALNGHLRRLTYFNRRLANSELQLLSS
jgi:hypothetical protein